MEGDKMRRGDGMDRWCHLYIIVRD
jgi:hypothetical protein